MISPATVSRLGAKVTHASTRTGACIRPRIQGRIRIHAANVPHRSMRTLKTSTHSKSKGGGKDSNPNANANSNSNSTANSNSNGAESESPKFSWNQVFLQWALGVYVSTPIIAILQGSLLLNNYRVNHSDAPRPVMPARGVAVAIDEERTESLSSWILHPFSSSSSHHPQGHERPLRLLVVGDSLAAGVGMSKSGVPILPESIARALSKEMGGRAVYWTCVGTPGVSAAQLVKDIEEIEPYDPHPKGRQLERIVKEFQNRRRRWMERREHKDEQLDSTENENEERMKQRQQQRQQHQQQPQNATAPWWKRMGQQGTSDSEKIPSSQRWTASEWWSNIRSAFRKRTQLVQEDISVIKEIVLKPMPQLDDDDDDYYYDYYRENLPADDAAIGSNNDPSGSAIFRGDDSHDQKPVRIPLIHKGSLFRRTSVIPKAAAEYDIAVVLTGLNDVKEAFMPHMNGGGGSGPKRLENSLRQVLEALREKMGGNMNLEGNGPDRNHRENASTTEPSSADGTDQTRSTGPESSGEPPPRKIIRHPLVVVPELPVAPLQFFRLVPLCWFLIPIFRAMENNKRFLASCFPDNVVFVHQPDLDWWSDDEMGIGSIRKNIQNEQLLLRVTDSVRSGRERIERLMKNYYDSKEEETIPASSDELPNSTTSGTDKGDFVSVDGIHPNDEGYELWGRHIAAAIIEHWNKTHEQ